MDTDENDVAPLLERQASRLLAQVAQMVTRHTAAALEALGANRSDFAVLATLDGLGADSQAGLSRRTNIDRSDMVAALAGLEASGHVARQVDANDRRRNVVNLTQAGRHHLARLAAALDQAQSEAFAPLSAVEIDQLRAMLLRLRERHRGRQTGAE